jgi:Helix-turn-helix domain
MAIVTQAYRFALDPTPIQRRALASHCGAARVAYNWGLSLVKSSLDQRQADPTPRVPWTMPELHREWNRAKDQVAPWWTENSKEAYVSGLDGLARALKNWSDSRSGRRKGRPVSFPRFKKKGRSRDACRFATGAIKVLADRKHVQLPRIGVLKTHESTRKLARRPEQGRARILAATISRQADRWFVPFTVEVERSIPVSNGDTTVVGVDAGIRHLAMLSTGMVIPNPKALERSMRKLRRPTGSSPAASPARTAGRPLDESLPGSTLERPTFAVTASTSSPPPSPPSMAPSWWSTSTWPGWSATATWPGPCPIAVWPSYADSLATRRPGTAVGWWWPTGSIPRPRCVRPAAG